MEKTNKKTIVIISIIVITIITIYQIFTKKEDYLEIGSNTNILNTEEENNLINKEETKDTENKIIVYITGAVNKEGVYELKENSRVSDSIEVAGGTTDEADLSNINLAYMLEDGVKIHIPKKGENINNIKDNTEEFISKENGDIEKNPKSLENLENSSNKSNISKNEKININTATQTDLEKLPGIGSSTALKIIEYRKENGKFSSIEDIKKVKGIGEAKYLKIKDSIKV